jgi:hypothetical protein
VRRVNRPLSAKNRPKKSKEGKWEIKSARKLFVNTEQQKEIFFFYGLRKMVTHLGWLENTLGQSFRPRLVEVLIFESA